MLSLSNSHFDEFLSRTADAGGEHGVSGSHHSLEALADSWKKVGLRPGDMVLLSLPNGKELLRQFFGVLLAGGVPALVAPMTPAARLNELSSTMGARAIGALRLPAGDLGAERVETIGPMKAAILPPPSQAAARPGEVVLLTSGTSGFSSGCVFDFDALLRNAERHANAIGQTSDDVVLVNLPLYFSFALVAQALGSLVRGNRLLIGGPPFHVRAYEKILQDSSITISSITPLLAGKLLESAAEFPTSLRVLSVGGAALDPESVQRLLAARPDRELYLTYGLTQAGPRVSTLAAHAEPSRRYASVGLPLADTHVFLREISDGSGSKQLFVSSDTVMKRPIGLVEGSSSQAPFENRTIATGDYFEQDEQGYLYFKGRIADFIQRAGEKINLASVRRVASDLPHVIGAKTAVIRQLDGSNDYDLELHLNSSADMSVDWKRLLQGRLRRADMPREIQIVTSSRHVAYSYK